MKKRILSLAVAACMLTGCSAADKLLGNKEYEPPEDVTPFNKVELTNYFEGEEDSLWYQQLREKLTALELEPVLDERVGTSELKQTFEEMRNDCPEVFWYGGWSMHPKGDSTRVEVTILQGLEADDLPKMYDELKEAAQEIINEIPSGSSDYEKALFVHDYIANHCEYDYDSMHEDHMGLWHTSYGALVDHKAVCAGYAEAFQYLMKLLGIEGGVCSGFSYRGGSHAWNYIKLDGHDYWIDVTWDDYEGHDPGHAYFLFNDEQMLRTRWLDAGQNYAPECDSSDVSWYKKNNAYFTEYNEDSISAITSANGGKCDIMFSDFETYKTALDELIGKNHMFKLDGVTGSVTYDRDDRMYVFRIL
ncbi:MAG: hypothetical protein J5501_03730 [Ruminococcus sp.]|nr:hypothetical protein [Ruminococcus sp.]